MASIDNKPESWKRRRNMVAIFISVVPMYGLLILFQVIKRQVNFFNGWFYHFSDSKWRYFTHSDLPFTTIYVR